MIAEDRIKHLADTLTLNQIGQFPIEEKELVLGELAKMYWKFLKGESYESQIKGQ